MDAQQPFFRARGAIAEMCGLYLKLSALSSAARS
jgi:hypothetical protein